MNDLTELLEVAVRAAHVAGRLHLDHKDRAFEVRSKSAPGDLVTEVDSLAEAAIREVIAGAYPHHAVLGEEGGRSGDAEEEWIVDPLDGTVNYAHGFPVSCVSIGFQRAGERLVGAVFDPNRNELFTATRGGGAFLNGRAARVSGRGALAEPALLATGFPYNVSEDARNLELLRRALSRGLPVRRPGAAALDLCYVACGRLDGYWEFGLKPWDSAAGSVIVEEAGGRVTDLAGEATPYAEMIVASNGHLHEELMNMLR
ncbi:inositol monophosphatase family protein [Deinococcus pimensis]|uniref:inositol monophosphatase family protein n=1 Tax=Deinococcus pimensis TaxID=309888 RepID=UPI0004814211|nr:inositol monophosphatase family protein [Deinococcus pimensis]